VPTAYEAELACKSSSDEPDLFMYFIIKIVHEV
jgi:hypothetical protein